MWTLKINIANTVIMCLSTILLNNYNVTGQELTEGSPCRMEDGSTGSCVKLKECEMWIKQIKENKRFPPRSAHCSFSDFDEVVCCSKEESTEESFILPENGKTCAMEDGSAGVCTAIPQCPYRVKQVLEGKRFHTSAGRCSFNGLVEIVCCPTNQQPTTNNVSNKLDMRPAERVCLEYEEQITGEDGTTINPNIINGMAAEDGEFPYMVALAYRLYPEAPSNISYICGGTLITDRHILTAAHCILNINNLRPFQARLGSVNLYDKQQYIQQIPISQMVHHPSYRPSQNYFDIAILTLSRPVSYSERVMPICLQTKPIPNLDQLIRASMVVTGWGVTNFNSDQPSSTLNKSPSLKIVDRLTCTADYQQSRRLPNGVDDSLICVLDEDVNRRSDACQGDSGGPLLLLTRLTSTIIGIVSFGQSCSSPIPGIYTSVYYHLDWIEGIVWPNRKRSLG